MSNRMGWGKKKMAKNQRIRVHSYQRKDGTRVKGHSRRRKSITGQDISHLRKKIEAYDKKHKNKKGYRTDWLKSHEGREINKVLNFDPNEITILCTDNRCYMNKLKPKSNKEEEYLKFERI